MQLKYKDIHMRCELELVQSLFKRRHFVYRQKRRQLTSTEIPKISQKYFCTTPKKTILTLTHLLERQHGQSLRFESASTLDYKSDAYQNSQNISANYDGKIPPYLLERFRRISKQIQLGCCDIQNISILKKNTGNIDIFLL